MEARITNIAQSCEYCGRWCDSGESVIHHLYQRSLRPDLIDDPKNKITLCGMCHKLVHDNRKLELYLIATFYGKTRLSRTGNAMDDGRGFENF
ncbi:MAG: HNH endonuclease [Patescibacteria group bacterium]